MKGMLLASSEPGRPLDLKEVEAPPVSASLEAHFPGQSDEWKGLMQEISEHNKSYKDFSEKIKADFESKGIPVVQDDRCKSFTFIYEDVFTPLFNMWRELAQGKHPWPDFQNIDTLPVEGGYFLHPSGWKASVIAFAKTEEDSKKCKLALAETAGDVGNQEQAAKMLDSVDKLVEKAREFANQFTAKLDEIDKYWPGKKTNKFGRLKRTCQTCKEL
jgi:hypothetical protein